LHKIGAGGIGQIPAGHIIIHVGVDAQSLIGEGGIPLSEHEIEHSKDAAKENERELKRLAKEQKKREKELAKEQKRREKEAAKEQKRREKEAKQRAKEAEKEAKRRENEG
jgi:hypothetical protein